MQKYNCIIVEDEPLAAEVLQDYISQVPFLELVKVCSDAIYAMEILQQEKIDLLFLDIHLPKLKGIDFIKILKKPPQIIITSAYQEYALSQKLQALQEEILQDELVAFTKGEQRFKNGEISLDAYTLALKTYNDEQVKNETLKKELRVKQATLESYLGMSMEDAFIQIGALLSQQAPVTESQNSGGVINK